MGRTKGRAVDTGSCGRHSHFGWDYSPLFVNTAPLSAPLPAADPAGTSSPYRRLAGVPARQLQILVSSAEDAPTN
jgi:hypothetical protein